MKEKIKNPYFLAFSTGFCGALICLAVIIVSSIILNNYYLIVAYAIIIIAGFLLRKFSPLETWRNELSTVLLAFPLVWIACNLFGLFNIINLY